MTKQYASIFIPSRSSALSTFTTSDPSTCNAPVAPLILAVMASFACDFRQPVNVPADCAGLLLVCTRDESAMQVEWRTLIRHTAASRPPKTKKQNLDLVNKTTSLRCAFAERDSSSNSSSALNIAVPQKLHEGLGSGVACPLRPTRSERYALTAFLFANGIAAPRLTHLDSAPWIERHLLYKGDYEKRCMRHACDITRRGFHAIWDGLQIRTVREAIGAFEQRVRKADGAVVEHAYTPIFTQSPVIHSEVEMAAKIDFKRPIVMDMGVRYNGVCCDITRTFYMARRLGGVANRLPVRLHRLVRKTLKHITHMVRPGVAFQALSEACERKLARGLLKLGLCDDAAKSALCVKNIKGRSLMPHAVGHSVGWNVHDDGVQPAGWVLQAGQTLALEPGLYFPEECPCPDLVNTEAYAAVRESGMHAVRIEDTMLVTANGVNVLSGGISRSIDAPLARLLERTDK